MTRFRSVYSFEQIVAVGTVQEWGLLYHHCIQDVWKRLGEGSQLRSFFFALEKIYHIPKVTTAKRVLKEAIQILSTLLEEAIKLVS